MSPMMRLSVALCFGAIIGTTSGILFSSNDQKDAKDSAEIENNLPLNELQQFTNVMAEIHAYYVKDVQNKDLIENAITGMVAGLDPHSAYLDKDSYEDLKISTSGKFGGLGLEVSLENDALKVVTPIDDTPASRAGIKAGDLIIRLDDEPVQNMSLRDAVNKMRGKKGTSITLTILREDVPKPLKFTLKRDVINVVSTKYRLLDSQYAYLRIAQFQAQTGQEVDRAIADIKKQAPDLKGLVLDLRNNPGGILESAVAVASDFLDHDKIGYDGIVVYTKGRAPNSSIKEIAQGNDKLNNLPMVVLVNQGSASAAEIVAGALKDHRRAIIMGTKTFGKGSVQTVLPLSQDTGLKLTTALYYTPNGSSIQAEGIEPDVVVSEVVIETKPQTDLSDEFLKESDLKDHFAATEGSVTNHAAKSDTAMAATDYQLNEALNLLKGLSVSKNTHRE